jgi:DNA repair exonuclease SbcCD ATPase subunit
MKNVFVIFLMGFSLTIMAQHVTPLDIKIAELNLDSLRGAYLAQPTMYRASLDVVAEQLEENAQQIKEAQNELRIEMIHAKEMRRVLNEGVKRLSVLKKIYAKEEAEIKALMETLENQRQKLEKQTELNQQTRDGYIQMFSNEYSRLEQTLSDLANRVQEATLLSNELQNATFSYQTYEQELERKAFDLAQVEALYETRKDALKAEQRAAKSLK